MYLYRLYTSVNLIKNFENLRVIDGLIQPNHVKKSLTFIDQRQPKMKRNLKVVFRCKRISCINSIEGKLKKKRFKLNLSHFVTYLVNFEVAHLVCEPCYFQLDRISLK